MNLAIGMWVLLAGGWVLPNGVGDNSSIAVPSAGGTSYQVGSGTADTGAPAAPAKAGPPAPPAGAARATRHSGYGAYGGYPAPAQQRPRFMPMMPTGGGAVGAMGMPMAPTAGGNMPDYAGAIGHRPSAIGGGLGGRPVGGLPSSGMGMLPSFTAMESRRVGGNAPATIGMNSPLAGVGRKPFTGYQPPPAISPYMNLYRTDNNNSYGTIDNWTTLVRPQLDQYQQNLQLNNDVNNLQTQTGGLVAPPRNSDQNGGAGPQSYNNVPGTAP